MGCDQSESSGLDSLARFCVWSFAPEHFLSRTNHEDTKDTKQVPGTLYPLVRLRQWVLKPSENFLSLGLGFSDWLLVVLFS
jgi:hypothetical protein